MNAQSTNVPFSIKLGLLVGAALLPALNAMAIPTDISSHLNVGPLIPMGSSSDTSPGSVSIDGPWEGLSFPASPALSGFTSIGVNPIGSDVIGLAINPSPTLFVQGNSGDLPGSGVIIIDWADGYFPAGAPIVTVPDRGSMLLQLGIGLAGVFAAFRRRSSLLPQTRFGEAAS